MSDQLRQVCLTALEIERENDSLLVIPLDVHSPLEGGLGKDGRELGGNQVLGESRLELEVAFESLDELERFWGSIDPEKHMAWGQKVKGVVLDGTPLWEVYRGVDPFGGGHRAPATSSAARPSAQASQDVLEIASWDDMDRYAGKNWGSTFQDAKELLAGESAPSEPPGEQQQQQQEQQQSPGRGPKPRLDWKGDPMVVNPGDRLPFTFE